MDTAQSEGPQFLIECRNSSTFRTRVCQARIPLLSELQEHTIKSIHSSNEAKIHQDFHKSTPLKQYSLEKVFIMQHLRPYLSVTLHTEYNLCQRHQLCLVNAVGSLFVYAYTWSPVACVVNIRTSNDDEHNVVSVVWTTADTFEFVLMILTGGALTPNSKSYMSEHA
ncbi:hypothetical protein X801_07213 [Opisthorchis viverrini]|uniref:Uncharacterized protein n=1 Tax=Opisthorchis viverrini TaxID=6198 RepID=A0A1S8WR43_OPIVI|nr:hypothetical protein X801_07213 [Opisthorchis viverrini]